MRLILLFLSASFVFAQGPNAPKRCLKEGPHQQFDFWLGEWDVEVQGKKIATSRIERIVDGCIIQESWMPFGGVEGKSWNYFNLATQKWEQLWIAGGGGIAKFVGEWKDGAIRYNGQQQAGGKTIQLKMTFTPLPEKRVHQLYESSNDEGKTWSVAFDGIYVPKKS